MKGLEALQKEIDDIIQAFSLEQRARQSISTFTASKGNYTPEEKPGNNPDGSKLCRTDSNRHPADSVKSDKEKNGFQIKVTEIPEVHKIYPPELNKRDAIHFILRRELVKEWERHYLKRIKEQSDVFSLKPLETTTESLSRVVKELTEASYKSFLQVNPLCSENKDPLQTEALLYLEENLKTSLDQSIVDNLNHFYTLYKQSKENDCVFIRHLFQETDPLFYLASGQCAGTVFNWAIELLTNPPSEYKKPTASFLSFLSSLETLFEQKRFPDKCEISYPCIGEPLLNFNTFLLQKYHKVLLLLNKYLVLEKNFSESKTITESTITESILAVFEHLERKRRDMQRFMLLSPSPRTRETTHSFIHNSDKNPICTFLGLILYPIQYSSHSSPHMIGICEIRFANKIWFRIFDADTGEFESHNLHRNQSIHEKKFGRFLQFFMQQDSYKKYKNFDIVHLNPILDKAHIIISDLEKEYRQQPLLDVRIALKKAKTILENIKKSEEEKRRRAKIERGKFPEKYYLSLKLEEAELKTKTELKKEKQPSTASEILSLTKSRPLSAHAQRTQKASVPNTKLALSKPAHLCYSQSANRLATASSKISLNKMSSNDKALQFKKSLAVDKGSQTEPKTILTDKIKAKLNVNKP